MCQTLLVYVTSRYTWNVIFAYVCLFFCYVICPTQKRTPVKTNRRCVQLSACELRSIPFREKTNEVFLCFINIVYKSPSLSWSLINVRPLSSNLWHLIKMYSIVWPSITFSVYPLHDFGADKRKCYCFRMAHKTDGSGIHRRG